MLRHLMVFGALAFAPACVDTGRSGDNGDTTGDIAVVHDLKVVTKDMSVPPTQIDLASSGPMCVTQCFTDGDCQNSCPAAPNGINCCDVSTNTCFVSNDQVCPAPTQGGDAGTSPY